MKVEIKVKWKCSSATEWEFALLSSTSPTVNSTGRTPWCAQLWEVALQLPSCPQLHIVEQQHGTLNSTGGTLLWCAQLHTGVSLVCSNSNSSTSSTLHNNCALQHLCCALCSAVRGCSGVLNCDGALLHWWWCAQLILFTCGDVQMPTLMDRRSNPHCYELVALCKKTSQELQMLSSVSFIVRSVLT